MASIFHFWSFSIYLVLAIGTFRSCNGYANFENANNVTIARICESLLVDHSTETNNTIEDPSWVAFHVLQHIYTPGTTKKIIVSLRHSVINSNTQRKLKGFIVQARASSAVGVGTWLPGENEMVLQCGEGSTAIVQRNGTVERELPITLVYNAPAEDLGPIKFFASWVENLSTYSKEPTESYPLTVGGPCDGTPCYNLAECILDETDSRGHTCNCPIGFTGPDCEDYVCGPNTCDSNKLCHFDVDDEDPNELHLCKCILPGYTGENCDMGPCTSSPCENGGTCYETNSGVLYTCRCPEHYSGDRCEIAGPCVINPCNTGVCRVNGTGYFCDCSMVPFEGEFCQHDSCLVDQSLNGCKNGFECYLSSTGNHKCRCGSGYVGNDCGTHICDLGPCNLITHQCQVAPSASTGYYCNCSILFTDDPQCNVRTGIPITCSEGNPCQNGGTCVEKTATGISPLPFMCSCTVEFKGTLCDEPKTRCEIAGYPCQNQGICNDNVLEPICTCVNGYNNTYCQDDVAAPEISCTNRVVTEQGLYEYSVYYITDYGIQINDNSDAFFSIWDPTPSVVLPVGTTTVHVTALDFAQNSADCWFNITLPDTIPPDLLCPSDTIFTTRPGEGSTFVTLPTATSSDNFSNVTLTISMNDNQTLPVGVHEVVVTSVDEDGNSINCTFWIQVEEPQVLYVAFSVDEQFVEAYFNTSSPSFREFSMRVENAMLTEMSGMSYVSSYSGIMVLSLRSGSVVVNTAILMNSNTNTSDPAVVADFTATVNASISNDGMLGNMSIVPGSFVISENICALSSCLNGGVCLGGNTSFILCNCTNTGYQGQLCDQKIDYCAINVCENGGTCTSELRTFTCDCTMDFTGPTCSIAVDHCEGSPCQNGGTCTSGMNGMYACDCSVDFEGNNCQTLVDHCASTPCMNNGNCTSGSQGTFTCDCSIDFTGNNCSESVNHCAGVPCLNGGFCESGTNGAFSCTCLAAFTGDICQTELDLCADMQCANGGSCTTEPNGFVCSCTEDFTGVTCDIMVDHCLQNPCSNGGTCSLNEGGGFTCNCTIDFTGDTCQTAVNHCADQPCQNDGGCTSLVNGQFLCECTSGFTGTDCSQPVLMCDPNPCQNGGTCNSFGTMYNCTCTTEFEGLMCQLLVDHCDPNPCQNNGACARADGSYSCVCQPGIVGNNCQTDLCSPNPCQNGGECQRSQSGSSCSCATGFTGTNCSVTNYCDPDPCMNGGQCLLLADSYECNCVGTGFIGTECQTEDLDPCAEVPCLHNGTCTKLTEPGSYNCTCDEVNWTGVNCETDLTPCMPNPCHNGGTCTGGTEAGSYTCTCDEIQWTGTLCEIDLTPCTPNPCLNDGNCTVHVGEVARNFSCACNETEWTGPLCETDVTPCDPFPCLNGGNCTEEGPGLFSCQCDEVEWTGATCELDVTPCDPLPCLNGANCTELGPANYSCDCSAKWTGQNCHIDLVPCQSSPCRNGGICQNGTEPGTFACACVRDWTGDLCGQLGATCRENPCQNGGTCTPSAEGRTCQCTTEYEGDTCGTLKDAVNECGSDPCMNGGTCLNLVGNYACNCPEAFTGVNCENDNVDTGQLTGTTSSWWIIAICLCFLIIIGIAAAFVCVSMSKKASN